MITDKQTKNAYKAYVNQFNRDTKAGIDHVGEMLEYEAFINVYDLRKEEGRYNNKEKKFELYKKGANIGGAIARDQRYYNADISRIYGAKLDTIRKNEEAYKRFLEKVEKDPKLLNHKNLFTSKNSNKFKKYIKEADPAFMSAFKTAWDQVRSEMLNVFSPKEALAEWSEGGS